MKMRAIPMSIKALVLCCIAQPAFSHVSEQGFVLLLPTGFYTAAGVITVFLTVAFLALVPGHLIQAMYRFVRCWPVLPGSVRVGANTASALVFFALVLIGLLGSRDPLTNALPLAVWTIWWIGLVSLQGVVVDVWRWVSPFAILSTLGKQALLVTYPSRFGHGPAIALFLAFAAFVLADPAPSDPTRLAWIAAGYWVLTAAAVAAFGRRWLVRGEPLTVLMRSYRRQSLFGKTGKSVALGFPGWQVANGPALSTSASLFIVLLLGTGSFDGLNETFWWLGLIGINPLEFPGRSAVVVPTIVGLIVSNMLLVLVFVFCLWIGLVLSRAEIGLASAFRLFAPSLLPIALGYHIAHYLTSFLVDGQYAVAALTDPLARGDDLLGLGTFYVTTGFFNTEATVRIIWLSQAGAVVIGHVLGVLLADALAVQAIRDRRKAFLCQLPLAAFMIAYTMFGLWLLASPRGL